jgi:biotin carboxyl carrier protein
LKYQVQISGKLRAVEIQSRENDSVNLRIDDRPLIADVAEINASTYSIVIGGRSFEARVSREAENSDGLLVRCAGRDYRVGIADPRAWRAGRSAALEAAGGQRVLAPMPGRVVRLLVSVGESVEAGAGLLVVEAMKMQNEIRAPKSGKIERVLVTDGQAVRSQEALIIIE